MKKTLCFILSLLMMIIMTGCWDYKEIDEEEIISGIAIDYDEKSEELILTFEFILPTSEGGDVVIGRKLIEARGESMPDAIENFVARISSKPFFGHISIVVLSDSVVRKEDVFKGIIDWFERNREIKTDINIAFSKEESARYIFNTTELEKKFLSSMYMDDTFNSINYSSNFFSINIIEMSDKIKSKYTELVLPIVKVSEMEEIKVPVIEGTQIFNDTKPVGELDEDETRDLLILENMIKKSIIPITMKGVTKEEKVFLRVYKSKTGLKTYIDGEDVKVYIDTSLTLDIDAIQGEVNYVDSDNREKLKSEAKRQIGENLEELIDKLQKEYKADVLGVGAEVEKRHPKDWAKLKREWKERYEEAEFNVNVNIKFRKSGFKA